VGLVLTGGGARGAYQAGVLRGIADRVPRGAPTPFRILTGVSAGAINSTFVASFADDFRRATDALWQTWAELEVEQVFRTDLSSISALAVRWARDLALGGALGASTSTHLLDTQPLRRLLADKLDLVRLAANVRTGLLHGVSVSATNYGGGAAVSFFDAHPAVGEWTRSSRLGKRSLLGLSHVMASAAIPVVFPPEPLEGGFWGDGCVRLTAPLSPAIHLGADAVVAVGIRHARSLPAMRVRAMQSISEISAVDIAGVLLNAIFLDSLEADLERMERINRTVALLPPTAAASSDHCLKSIPVTAVLPSMDLGALAGEEFARLPRTLRYMLRGLGASDEKGWDLVSYLAFDGSYTRRLLELGRTDAHAHAAAIEAAVEGATSRAAA
jgi:NTE family protein